MRAPIEPVNPVASLPAGEFHADDVRVLRRSMWALSVLMAWGDRSLADRLARFRRIADLVEARVKK
jgi:hypothetical protein